MSETKVLIACPTLAGINPNPQEWLASLITILNDVRKNSCTHATFLPYKMNWWDANNIIWDTAFQHKFDYILRIDDDIWDIPLNGFSKLLTADKDVIGAAYPSRYFPYRVSALNKVREDVDLLAFGLNKEYGLKACQDYMYEGQEPEKVDLVGFGMTLIKVAPFRFCTRPMFKGDQVCPDDSYFAQVCADNKIEQYVHWGVRLKHRHVTFANAGYLFNGDVMENAHGKEMATSI